jgi:hypothetical protein
MGESPILRWKRAALGASWCRWSRALTLALEISLLPLANSAASDVPPIEWHIHISIPRHTYYGGETINVTETICPAFVGYAPPDPHLVRR